jgi:methyl-accepting chemotaxis protein
MNPEMLSQVENLIEKFGFPIFVALCALILFAAVFRYMTKALEKKDCDFMDYVEKRDAQIDAMVDKHNRAFRDNTDAINQMRSALEARTEYVKEQTSVLHELTESTKTITNGE